MQPRPTPAPATTSAPEDARAAKPNNPTVCNDAVGANATSQAQATPAERQESSQSTVSSEDVRMLIASAKEFARVIRIQLREKLTTIRRAIEEKKRQKIELHSLSMKLEEEMRILNARYKETRESLQRISVEVQEGESMWEELTGQPVSATRADGASGLRNPATIRDAFDCLLSPSRMTPSSPQTPAATAAAAATAQTTTGGQTTPSAPQLVIESSVDKAKKRIRIEPRDKQSNKRTRTTRSSSASAQKETPPLITLAKGSSEIADLWTYHEIAARHNEEELGLILDSSLRDAFHEMYPKKASVLAITDNREIEELKEKYPEKSSFLENESGKCVLISNEYYQFASPRLAK